MLIETFGTRSMGVIAYQLNLTLLLLARLFMVIYAALQLDYSVMDLGPEVSSSYNFSANPLYIASLLTQC